MKVARWFKRLYWRLRKFVASTVNASALTVTAIGTTGQSATVAITGITINGVQAPDGTTVSIPFTQPNGTADADSPLTGTTVGGAFSTTWTETEVPGTYNFGPAVIGGQVVASAVAAFTRSQSLLDSLKNHATRPPHLLGGLDKRGVKLVTGGGATC